MSNEEAQQVDDVIFRFHQIECLIDTITDYIAARPNAEGVVMAALGAVSAFAADSRALGDKLTA